MTEQLIVDTQELKAFIAKFKQLDTDIPAGALRRAGHEIGKEYVKLLLKPTASWEHKPNIKHLVRVSQKGVIVLVTVNDAAYVWVTLGTRPHRIDPKRAQRLAFQSGYTAKTTPGSLAASSGGKFGPVVYSMGVFHPGVKARDFHVVAFEEIREFALRVIIEELKKELAKLT